MVYRVGELRKEVRKPKENMIWHPTKLDIKGSSSGTKDDKEMEANIAFPGEKLQATREDKNSNVVQVETFDATPNSINAVIISNIEGESAETNQFGQVPSFLLNSELPKDPLQDVVHILENQKDVSDEECEEVWCDKENKVASESIQLKGKQLSDLPKNLVDEMENVLAENKMQRDLAMGYCSSQEEGEVIGSRGNQKTYDSEGVNRSDVGKCKKFTSDKTVRKSRRVHEAEFMIRNILYWNVRGLGSSKRRLKSLIIKKDINICAIVEPFISDNRMATTGPFLNLNYFCSNVFAGGKL
ncbi:hypothetical protein ACLOJK_023723 [Asimina triloba]